MKRQIADGIFMGCLAGLIFLLFCMMCCPAFGQTCEEQCYLSCIVGSQEVCDACLEACEDRPRRVAPAGPTVDPWLHGGYLLERTIGVTQLAHEYFYDAPYAPNRLTYLGSNLELAEEVRSYGFRTLKIWMRHHPFDGLGEPFCYDLFNTGDGDWWCETDTVESVCDPICHYTAEPRFEDMIEFWRTAPVDQIFVRFERWGRIETRPDGTECLFMSRAPYYEVAKELYRLIGWRDITIVFTDWEQDWQVLGCGTTNGGMPDMSWLIADHGCGEAETEAECRHRLVDIRLEFVLSVIDERQRGIERARKEAWIERGHAPALRILHSVILNRWPGNMRPHEVAADLPTLAESLHRLKRSPDVLGISYWKRGDDPALALDWFEEVTGYPRSRFYVDEFGSKQSRQVERYQDYISAFWSWGIRTVNVWLWKQTWCADFDRNSLGLWVPLEPCEGRVVYTGPSDGLAELQRMNIDVLGTN